MSLQGKTVLITGASKGIGRALALMLAQKQVNLGLVARSEIELLNLKAEIELLGAQAEIFVGDVSDSELSRRTVETLLLKFGKLDAVINNAGYGVFKAAEDVTEEEWENVYNVNVKGTFLFSKAAIPAMKAAGSGHIINIASDVAKRVFDGGSLYCSSKFAQDAFSMALRKEVRRYGIKVSVVYSGLVDTHFHTDPQGDEKHNDWLKDTDMADVITYILSAPKHVVIDELMIHPMSQEY
ncbi:NADP-dependent 3-hydroxy acid dehydrogenase YdfG [Pseudarcicella hirudinis]|uniref:NADP-dependent 3-hydroxy acid dehydrogenase YdfG n=1 Tax=Pseudarcicella hirudinis TaxID=1079859 RepID=A0A1I5W1N2_9BACT|nr:SDR family oxidoreductase [Pseudarcicella hirudinis]SFQ13497.1 NADP-dependent 3-hydroxy acid dehydrogenase YdfG [Pseudarcicella hirudinis]